MSNQHLPYISLDSIIKDYLVESEQSNNKYFKIWHLAFLGFSELGIDFFYQIKAVKLPINANLTVTLPADFTQWTKVGVLNNKGEIIPLYYNDKPTTYADLSPNRLTQTQDNTNLPCGEWGLNTWCNYWYDGAYVNIYGVPSGAPFVGDFKIDTVNGVILLNEKFKYDYVMLEYVSTPAEGQEYYLPVQFRMALMAWLYWRDSKAKSIKSHMQLGNNGELKHDFYNERRNAIARWKPTRIYEIYEAHQEQSRMAIKT